MARDREKKGGGKEKTGEMKDSVKDHWNRWGKKGKNSVFRRASEMPFFSTLLTYMRTRIRTYMRMYIRQISAILSHESEASKEFEVLTICRRREKLLLFVTRVI